MTNSASPTCRAVVSFPCEGGKSYESLRRADDERWPAKLQDISASGVALVTPCLCEPGAVLSVELPGPGNQPRRNALAYVIRACQVGTGEWLLGCRFAVELRDEDLGALGARRQSAPPPDDRGWVRFPCAIETRYEPIEPERTQWAARVSRLTLSGADLILPRSFEPGSLLSMDLTDETGKFSRTMLACVVYTSNESESECAVACTFASELAPGELEMLL
ncbi:MAG TPA: PilZ domain-containing protein [Gemmataceae bacterium]|nr:PilZ domain-containing protein [Gemmataceae bacterium]